MPEVTHLSAPDKFLALVKHITNTSKQDMFTFEELHSMLSDHFPSSDQVKRYLDPMVNNGEASKSTLQGRQMYTFHI